MRRHDASVFLHGRGDRERVEFRVFEIFRQPAPQADVMVVVLEVGVEADAFPVRAKGGDQPEAVEEPQRPIHGVDRHRRNPRPDPPEDGFRIGMLRAPGDLAENLEALVRELHARLLAGGLEPLEPPPNLDAVSFQVYAPTCILYLDRNVAASMRPVKGVEVFNEHRAENAALRKLADPTAFVCRDGQYVKIPAEEVVPGDVILLQAGSPGPP